VSQLLPAESIYSSVFGSLLTFIVLVTNWGKLLNFHLNYLNICCVLMMDCKWC